MAKTHKEYAYAKINPYLAVTGRRSDGYHTILSHMQAVTLCDVLTFHWEPNIEKNLVFRLHCSDNTLVLDESNLVCRAARAMAKRLAADGRNIAGHLTVQLEKNIPLAAGLAGGSADAAATLRALNVLWDCRYAVDTLCEIGAALGADIPFCIKSTTASAMTARGIGEQLSNAKSLSRSCYLVIACHGEGVSTPLAYRQLDEQRIALTPEEAERQYAALEAALAKENLGTLAACCYNCFEQVVLHERPAAAALIDAMKKGGAVFARMSGSGPSVVGYFENEAKAKDCADTLRLQGIAAQVCQPLF